jgi:hypothetical protein
MVGIVIEHNLIAVPQPIVGVGVIGLREAEKESAEPKTRRSAAAQAIDVAPADTAGESPMLEGPVEMVRRIVASGIMPYPLVVGMDVWSFRMAGLVRETPVARRAALLDATRFLLSSWLLLPGGLLLHSGRGLTARRGRTVGRYMATASPPSTTASRFIPSLLGHTKGQGKRRS